MTQQEFNQQHPTGEQLTMIHYDFETGKRTAQQARVMGTKTNPDDEDEFLVVVLFTATRQQYEMDPGSFGMFSNIDNL
jgi:hypothetical protein